ncbi:MAG: hypothetical protein WBM32_19010 [Crocosphaera sp.]
MSTFQLKLPQAIEYLRSLSALVKVNDQGYPIKVSWGYSHPDGLPSPTDKGLEYLSKFTTLIELELGNMEDEQLAYLSKLENLNCLRFNHPLVVFRGGITDNGLPHIKELVNLEILDFGRTSQITDMGLPILAHFKKLQFLNLTQSSLVTVKGLEQLKGLSELRCLGVPDTLSLKYVQHFPTLEIINICDTNDSEIQYLETLNNIQELYIYPDIDSSDIDKLVEVTDASIKTLIQLKTLKKLSLWQTKISEQGVKQIQNELSNCEIEFVTINDEKA